MSARVGIQSPLIHRRLHYKDRHECNEDNDIDLGYYIHQKKLGEGGFGTVRLATHLKTGQKVAVKIMNKAKMGSDLFRAYTEINALKTLNHENIARLLQVIETENEIYLVLEYCSGGELFDYLVSKYRLSEEETKIIMRDLANVLSFIHEKGLAHRDLKPENILFDENRKIKLIDFGLSANSQDFNTSLSHLSTCCGSPAYAAPELLQQIPYSGPSADVWSAGILLYALLVGRLPFESENQGILFKKIQSGVFYCPKWLSNEALDLIRLMLKTDPTERLTIKGLLSHPWLRIIGDQEINTTRSRRPSFDEVLGRCHDLFPKTPINELKQRILTGFGYHTATYWLISKNPGIIQGSEISSQFPTFDSLKENRDQRRRSKSVAGRTENENTPKVIGAKRKMIECETLNGYQIKRWSPKEFEVRFGEAVASTKRELLACSPSRIPTLKTTPNSAPNPKDPTKLVKSKQSKRTPVISNKNQRLLETLNGSNERDINGKSPLRTFVKSFVKNSAECTPKRSLFKRLLDSATPSKTPKKIIASTDAKNITLTKFTDPQKCIDKIVETLKARGIQCIQKSFTLRCVLSSLDVIILSFSLEICKWNEFCVIQRKRITGDAWDYKKVCEELLRISNE